MIAIAAGGERIAHEAEILVTQTSPTGGIVVCGGLSLRCAVGRGGVRAAKQEGDGATPAGRFALRQLLFRPDRVAPVVTFLPVSALAPDDGWCDDPRHAAYNRAVRLPFEARHERLWREDKLYDIIIVIGCNDRPARPGYGSAIFLHVAHADFAPTEGCVAVDRDGLIALAARAGPATQIVIRGWQS